MITDADLVTNRERYPWQYAAGGWDQYDQFYGQFHMSPEEYYERYSEYPAGWFGTESDDSSTETETAPAVDDSHSPSMSAGAEAAGLGIIGGADGPTAIFVTSAYDAQAMWGLAVKVFSNVLVIVLNYVFSKLIIFKKKQ